MEKKKEIWKLIELLNEYENRDDDQQIEWRIWEWDKWENGKVRWIVNDVYMWWVSELVVCSAYYWFIKWLVENDKIDTDPIRTRVKRVYVELEPREFTPQDFVDRVIMLLSISDTPIEDIILYLK